MSWQSILKVSFPKSQHMFVSIMLFESSRNRMFKDLEELDLSVESNRNKLSYINTLLKHFKGGQTSIETLFTQPHLDAAGVTLSEIKEHIEKLERIIETEVFMSVKEAEELVDKALDALNDEDFVEVERILEEVDTKASLGKRTLESNRDLRAKLRHLRKFKSTPYLSFEGIPENSNILEEFAKKIDGEVIGDMIKVKFTNASQFIKAIKPANCKFELKPPQNPTEIEFHYEINKDTKEPYPSDPKREEIFKYFTINLRKYKWKYHKGASEVSVDNLTTKNDAFIASRVKYSLDGGFSARKILDYINAVNDMDIGSVEQFKPKKFGNRNAAKMMFLEKVAKTDKQLLLSPFTEILIRNPDLLTNKGWFKMFFQQIRATQVMSEKQAENHIINDLYRSIRDLNEEADLQGMQGINEHGFTKEEINSLIEKINNIGDTDISNKTEQTIKQSIKRFIGGASGFGVSFRTKRDLYKETQLASLQETFTPTEEKAFKQDWQKIKELDEELKDYKIEYFKDGKNLGGMQPKRDKKGKEIKDSKNQSIMYYHDGGGTEGAVAKITLIYDNDETAQYTPEDAYENDLKIKATTLTESTVREEGITEKEEELKRLQDKRDKLAEEGGKKPQLKELDNLIDSLKEDISSSQESKITPKDIKGAIQDFRAGHAQEDFATFVINTAYKLKDTGGLAALISRTPEATKNPNEKISAEMGLIYLSQMSFQANSSVVSEAFKKIDATLESGEAMEEAKALNDKMPTILGTIVSTMVTAFEETLTKFINNPSKLNKYSMLPAIKSFLDHRLIKAGE